MGLFGGGGFLGTVLNVGANLLSGNPLGAASAAIQGIAGSQGRATAGGTYADASNEQVRAAQQALDEQRRQFDKIQELLQPYIETGVSAMGAQKNILGLGTPEAQQQMVNQISNDPIMQALMAQGESAIAQNASATGGLRGGNVQSALAQFRPNLINQQIQQRFANLGGLTTLGQSSAVRAGTFGQNFANEASPLYQDIGAYRAGNIINRGQLALGQNQSLLSGAGNLINSFGGLGGSNLLGTIGSFLGKIF